MVAILLLVSNNQINEPYQYLDDIIGVYDDNHPFTDYELERFNFLTINGTRADVQAKLNSIIPRVAIAFLTTSDNWTFEYPGPENTAMEARVWTTTGLKWFFLVQDFKFPMNISELTPEEKQLLETFDINHPSVDSAIRKIVKDLVAANPDNNTECKDLKNQTP